MPKQWNASKAHQFGILPIRAKPHITKIKSGTPLAKGFPSRQFDTGKGDLYGRGIL